MTWEPWFSYALLIFAGISIFIVLEYRDSPLADEEYKTIDAGIPPPAWCEVLAAIIFFIAVFGLLAVYP
ncbi:MAG: hypothetical protein A2Z40_04060 [Deltaproteobacteria bacterium RBG_19FT_COMBO_60_16]|nr:MAG: hypothetical protein A2Z40_04060 [Deltaproteobacteria bacterium RBG_19FT_COMBO_60_16]